MSEGGRRKLTVISCEVGYTGPKRDGSGDFTLYDIEAVNEAGEGIALALRSFTPLPLGELREYEVKPYEKGGEIKNYTLSLPRKGGQLGARVDELRGRVEKLEAFKDWAVAEIKRLRSGSAQPEDEKEDIPF